MMTGRIIASHNVWLYLVDAVMASGFLAAANAPYAYMQAATNLPPVTPP